MDVHQAFTKHFREDCIKLTPCPACPEDYKVAIKDLSDHLARHENRRRAHEDVKKWFHELEIERVSGALVDSVSDRKVVEGYSKIRGVSMCKSRRGALSPFEKAQAYAWSMGKSLVRKSWRLLAKGTTKVAKLLLLKPTRLGASFFGYDHFLEDEESIARRNEDVIRRNLLE